MKSWLHEISESYVGSRVASRKDLKENYVSLTEEQRLGLLSENVLNYLNEQLQNAYGIGIEDLNEEQLNELLGGLAALAGRAVGGIARGAKAVGGAIKKGAQAVGGALAKPIKSGLDVYASGEEERAKGAVERAGAIRGASTLGGKLKAAAQVGKGVGSAFKAGMAKPAAAETEEETEKETTPVAAAKPATARSRKMASKKPGC